LKITLLGLVEIKLAFKYFFLSMIVEISLIIGWVWGGYIELFNFPIYRRDLTSWNSEDDAGDERSADVDNSPLQAVHGWGWKMHWGWEANLRIGYRFIYDNTQLQYARNNAMKECLLRNDCQAVTCWSSNTIQSGRSFVWRCQLRAAWKNFQPGNTAYRVRTYTPEVEGYIPPVPKYTGPDFVGAGVWGMHWGRDVSQRVWGPAGNLWWRESTLQDATKKAMERCKVHNKLVSGRADGAVCKAVVCWSVQTEAQESVATQWDCMLKGSSNHVAAATTAYRVRTYIPEACQKCANHRWKMHWGEENGQKVEGSANSEKVFVGYYTVFGGDGLQTATKQGKEACGHHNSVTTGNLCKSIACWTQQTVQQKPDATRATWKCQMRSGNVLRAANTDYRVQTYTPEACS